MTYTAIKYEVQNKVATITLNRADNLNSFTPIMNNELINAIDLAEVDDEVRVIIFTGAGKLYCAGMDLNWKLDYSDINYRDPGGLLALRLGQTKKPVIAAINGSAVGIGLTMTLPMDIRIVSETAKLGFTFTRIGIINESCSAYYLPHIVGISKAIELVATGRMFTAAEALAMGLVSYVESPDNVYEKAYSIAQEIANNTGAVAVALAKQLMWDMFESGDPMSSHKIESMCLRYLSSSADKAEGVKAFLEKRQPTYSMSTNHDMPAFYPWRKAKEFPLCMEERKDKD